MATSKADREFASYVVDMLQGMGPVEARPMFGGFGLFLDNLMFGLLADSELFFKVDSTSKAEFEELDLEPFTYYKGDKPMKMSYCQAPEECLENSQIMLLWGNKGFAAALRAPKKKAKKSA